MKNHSIRNIILIWLGWAFIIISFQHCISARLDLKHPDYPLSWTAEWTSDSQDSSWPKPFLSEQVAWDSVYYLSIASAGYDDPAIQGIPADFEWDSNQYFCIPGRNINCTSLNYAFFPLYSWLTWTMALPLRLLPLTLVVRTTLAAVIVSLLGALGAMLGLYFMSRNSLGEDGSVRAASYLLVFPSGFFMAQVYTEGLFLGLAFGALAFLSARKWGWAALFAALALAILASFLLLKERPELSLFGLAMTFFALTNGTAQGMIRYVLVVPAIFFVLARWGKNPVFDRVWIIISILLLGMEAMLFSFNFWVA